MAGPLKTSGVAKVSVVTSSEAEEPVSALLETIYGGSPSTWSNHETGESVISVYLRASPAALRREAPRVSQGLRDLVQFGLNPGRAEIRIEKVRREDWSESWKKYFKTIQISSSLLIKPGWSKIKPKRGQAVVVLDPGLSFGTGQHATTSFCLKQIADAARRARHQLSLLDIGSGSGILSIAAAKLGYAPVEGFDFDPVAVRVALKNCRINRVTRRVSIARKDLTKLPLRSRRLYDVVCANLISNLLIAQMDRILNRLAPGGRLVLAGILATEFETVRKACEAHGLKLIKSTVEREWQSGAFALS